LQNLKRNSLVYPYYIGINMSELLLRLQIWATQDNVSSLKKRYLLLSGTVVYGVAVMLFLITYFGPLSSLGAIGTVHTSILVGLFFSLISIGFVYVCRSVGICNLYSCMLLLGVIANLLTMLSDWQSYVRTGIVMSTLDGVLTFACVVAVAWLSLRLQHLFSRKKANTT
jgi:hypothetical protein